MHCETKHVRTLTRVQTEEQITTAESFKVVRYHLLLEISGLHHLLIKVDHHLPNTCHHSREFLHHARKLVI